MLPKKIRVHPTLDRSTLTKDDVTGCSECGSMKPMLLKARGELIACSECGAVQGSWNRVSKSYEGAYMTKSGYISGVSDKLTPDRPVKTLFFQRANLKFTAERPEEKEVKNNDRRLTEVREITNPDFAEPTECSDEEMETLRKAARESMFQKHLRIARRIQEN